MKGKKAAGAAIRRDRAELEARAVRAEHAERRLEAELSQLRDSSTQEIQALRTALAEMRRQRDETTNPLLVAAEERIRTLSADLLRERKSHERTEALFRKLSDGLVSEELKAGVTPAQAIRRVANIAGERFRVTIPDAPDDSDEQSPLAKGYSRAMQHKRRQAIGLQLAASGTFKTKYQFGDPDDDGGPADP